MRLVKIILPKAWIQDRKRDYYYRKAQENGYRSRAAYKLLQALTKYHFIKRGDVVVDLGAAPGGWIQVAKRIVGRKGFVLGIDLKAIVSFPQEYVRTTIDDMNDSEIVQRIFECLPREADVVISDVAPNISGVWDVDQARQIDLATISLKISLEILRPSGNFFVKVFEGDMLNGFITEVRKHFGFVKIVKPKASRPKSSELFILGTNFRFINEKNESP